MNNIIIFNLTDETSIIRSSHFVSNYKSEYPYAEITLCVYKDVESSAKLLKGVNNIVTIDREQIGDYFNNPLFSDSFAINSFYQNLGPILNTKWKTAINYSNDNVSAYLLSAIESEEYIGTRVSEYGAATTSNPWATYINYGLFSNELNPISSQQAKHRAAGLNLKSTEFNSLAIDENMAIKASQNFDLIRKRYTNSTNGKIIVVCLNSSKVNTSIDTYTKIIHGILRVDGCIPVLSISGTSAEKNIVNILNSQFGNGLVTINTEIQNVSAVFLNSDIVIGSNSSHLAVADSLGVPTVELVGKNLPANINAVTNESYLLCYQSEQVISDTEFILNHYFGLNLNNIYSTNSKIYQLTYDRNGPLKQVISGIDNDEIKYKFERDFLYQQLDLAKIDPSTNNFYLSNISYFQKMKNDLNDSTRILLSTIRSIKQLKSENKQTHIFFKNLEQLISLGKSSSSVALPIRIFEGNLENMENDTLDNLVVLESLLYKLKDDYKELLNLISQLIETKSTDSNQTYKPIRV